MKTFLSRNLFAETIKMKLAYLSSRATLKFIELSRGLQNSPNLKSQTGISWDWGTKSIGPTGGRGSQKDQGQILFDRIFWLHLQTIYRTDLTNPNELCFGFSETYRSKVVPAELNFFEFFSHAIKSYHRAKFKGTNKNIRIYRHRRVKSLYNLMILLQYFISFYLILFRPTLFQIWLTD